MPQRHLSAENNGARDLSRARLPTPSLFVVTPRASQFPVSPASGTAPIWVLATEPKHRAKLLPRESSDLPSHQPPGLGTAAAT